MRDSYSEVGPELIEPIRSPHFESTLVAIREKSPEIIVDVKKILETVDTQGLKNVFLFESENIPGVTIPVTKINVNSIFKESFGQTTPDIESSDDEPKKIVYFNFRSFATTPSGHPFTSWNIVYDRAITSFPKIANAMRLGETVPQIDIYSLGSPVGAGGQVSDEFLDALRAEGFAAHGKAYAELVRKQLPDKDENTQIIFNGNSLGCTVAEKTARELGDDYKINLLLDNPVNAENYPQVVQYLRGIQQAIGFVGEVKFGDFFNKRSKLERNDADQFNASFQKTLADRFGLHPDDKEQKTLKRTEMLLEEWNLIKGNPMDNETRRIFVRRGYRDPLTVKIHDLIKGMQDSPTKLKSLGQDGKISTYAIDASHFIDRVRIPQWKRAIELSKNIFV